MARTSSKPIKPAVGLPGWDALLLLLLTLALVRIDSLAESAVLPTLRQDVLRHPLLGGLLSPALPQWASVPPGRASQSVCC